MRSSPRLLSVTQVAEIAGVTPRTVRHYHAIGVLTDPPRDASGYRRYGSKEVIELVRVTRLRALGMSLPQIAEQVNATGVDDASLSEALEALAEELDAEMNRLATTRDRLRELARSNTFDRPAEALTEALQGQGVLGPADQLRAGESAAAAVIDALHPEGMPGVLARASDLFSDSTTIATLAQLRRRLGRLNATTPDSEIAALAADVAAIVPADKAGVDLDLGVVDLLLADRLNSNQQRFIRQLRAHLQDTP